MVHGTIGTGSHAKVVVKDAVYVAAQGTSKYCESNKDSADCGCGNHVDGWMFYKFPIDDI